MNAFLTFVLETPKAARTEKNDPIKVLQAQKKEKRGKYEGACHKQRKDFTPLVYSIDGMAGPATREGKKDGISTRMEVKAGVQ